MIDIYWWEKIWRNPTYRCKKCLGYDPYTTGTNTFDTYQRGFNKGHWVNAHKKGKEMATATPKAATGKLGDWYWHVHHQVLAEQLTDPLATRQAYVRSSKGAEVDTRLHFMRPVKNPPTGGVDQAALDKAQRVFNSVKRAYDNWGATADQLNAAAKKLDAAKVNTRPPTKADWEALHKKECFSYCPWDGKTLFPARTHGIA